MTVARPAARVAVTAVGAPTVASVLLTPPSCPPNSEGPWISRAQQHHPNGLGEGRLEGSTRASWRRPLQLSYAAGIFGADKAGQVDGRRAPGSGLGLPQGAGKPPHV